MILTCLFLGHKWKFQKGYKGTEKTYHRLTGKLLHKVDTIDEYYLCEQCGMWKKKAFINHELTETKYYKDRPIERMNNER